MAEDVSGAEPLLCYVDFERVGQPASHIFKDLGSQFVFAKHFLIALYGSGRHRNARLKVQRVLDVRPKDVSLDRLLSGSVVEVSQKHQPGH